MSSTLYEAGSASPIWPIHLSSGRALGSVDQMYGAAVAPNIRLTLTSVTVTGLPWTRSFARVAVVSALLLAGCTSSAEQDEQAEARRIQAERMAVVERQADQAIEQVRAHCSETAAEFRRLLRKHNGYMSDSLFSNLPSSVELLRGIEKASAHYVTPKPCARIIDSVARAQGLIH